MTNIDVVSNPLLIGQTLKETKSSTDSNQNKPSQTPYQQRAKKLQTRPNLLRTQELSNGNEFCALHTSNTGEILDPHLKDDKWIDVVKSFPCTHIC